MKILVESYLTQAKLKAALQQFGIPPAIRHGFPFETYNRSC